MEKLQDIINKKAKAKLEMDLAELNDVVWNKFYHLFNSSKLYINVGSVEKPKNINIGSIFTNDGFKKQLYEANIERYIEIESKDFVKRVEDLQNQIDELYEN